MYVCMQIRFHSKQMEQETETKKPSKKKKTRVLFGIKRRALIAMVFKVSVLLVLLWICSGSFDVIARGPPDCSSNYNYNSNFSSLAGMELPDHTSFNGVSSSSANSDCSLSESKKDEAGKRTVKLHLKRRWSRNNEAEPKQSVIESTARDLTRIQTLGSRIIEKKNRNTVSRLNEDNGRRISAKTIKQLLVAPAAPPESYGVSGQLMATLESGVSLGSGEYFMDVFLGSPPKHFSLILDTGSDLNWIQCMPCHDCFDQNGPYYDPKDSISFKNISCHDPRCSLVSSPDPPQPCRTENQTCPYYYWYGDSSNTTGDFALETFTVNLTSPSGEAEFKRVENVMFGCGHWNRGLFHGAAGLLGLGRGPLSFSSQLQSLYGHSFSYCLVDRNSDTDVSSKLIFGEDKALLSHPGLNFTSFLAGKQNSVDTFYYLHIKSIMVGGEMLKIPEETWELSSEGAGGTIIDSGTTLSYFTEPAFQIIQEAFVKKVKGYPLADDFPILQPCYNVSGVEKPELPEFGIVFADGGVWNFPVENTFIRLEPEEVVCLAIMKTPPSALSIIGNYQQQNFQILYDTKKSRLGYAPMKCADV